MDIHLYVLAGAGVGFLVGLTGVGGGSLMTPLLMLFGFPTHIAIGTDLVYAAATKASGVASHQRVGTIEWAVVRRLMLGSIPASLITLALLSTLFTHPEEYQHLLVTTLGAMLMMTSIVLLNRKRLQAFHGQESRLRTWLESRQRGLTIVCGAVLGACVTLSSVGAGAFGAAILLVLYPKLASIRIIGTDIAHAVPLTLIAGIGHWQLGNVDYALLGSLLIGSLPAIHVGTKLARVLPEKLMHSTLASVLLLLGVKYTFF